MVEAMPVIYEIIRKKAGPYKGQMVGVVAAVDRKNIGWSKWNRRFDIMDKERGVEIAVNRAIAGSNTPVPSSMRKYIGRMELRASRYFK